MRVKHSWLRRCRGARRWLRFALVRRAAACNAAQVGIWLLEAPHPAEWLLVPAGFLLANGFEYLVHRYPMHRRFRFLGALFGRHTVEHHAYFTAKSMTVDDLSEMKLVLFPPWVFGVFLAGVLPIYGAFHALLGPNACGIIVLTSVGYYLLYEWLHMLYHLIGEGGLGRLPLFRSIREHHRTHHDPRRMTEANFNITFPIFDHLFGTVGAKKTESNA